MDIVKVFPRKKIFPVYIRWLQRAGDGAFFFFPTGNLPRRAGTGDQIYICWRNEIYGSLTIDRFKNGILTDQGSGETLDGTFIIAVLPWRPLAEPVYYKGFRGFHYITDDLQARMDQVGFGPLERGERMSREQFEREMYCRFVSDDKEKK